MGAFMKVKVKMTKIISSKKEKVEKTKKQEEILLLASK